MKAYIKTGKAEELEPLLMRMASSIKGKTKGLDEAIIKKLSDNEFLVEFDYIGSNFVMDRMLFRTFKEQVCGVDKDAIVERK